MNWLDLHMHSNFSTDAEFAPEELLRRCAESGLKVVAVADHNCVRGVGPARQAAQAHEMLLLSAIEIDCVSDGQNFHVLGYGIDETAPEYAAVEENVFAQERAASETMIARVAALGIPFDHDWVRENAPQGVVDGELIAEAALREPQPSELLRPYQPGGARSDNPFVNFYWDFCSPGKPAYVPIRYPSLAEAVDLIHRTGGAAVLAHPGANVGRNREPIDTALANPLDGIEVYSSYHDAETRVFYHAIAQERGLLMTVGSDFHGKNKPSIALGNEICTGQGEMLYQLIQKIASY